VFAVYVDKFEYICIYNNDKRKREDKRRLSYLATVAKECGVMRLELKGVDMMELV